MKLITGNETKYDVPCIRELVVNDKKSSGSDCAKKATQLSNRLWVRELVVNENMPRGYDCTERATQ